LCSAIVPANKPNEVFPIALVAPDSVSEAVALGEMQPDDVEAVLNFEQSLYIKNEPAWLNTPISAPQNIHIETIQVSRFDDDSNGTVDREDFSLNFEVCSHVQNGVRQPAVTGSLRHMKTVSADLMALFNAEKDKVVTGGASVNSTAIRCDNGLTNASAFTAAGTCTLFVTIKRETEPSFQIVRNVGTQIGTTAFPGIDTNLLDYRKNGGAGNFFLNPTRWTGGGSWSRSNKYAACTYEYFAEPHRSAYLAKVGNNGIFRNDPTFVDFPCGKFEVDLGAAGSAAGVWIVSTKKHLNFVEDMTMPQVHDVLSGMLVLSEHFVRPTTHVTLSTHLLELSRKTGVVPAQQALVEFPRNTPPGKLTNVPFASAVPGNVYCYQGSAYLADAIKFNYLLEVKSSPEPTVVVERLSDGEFCEDMNQTERAARFTVNKLEFVR
jgi:hypothetical protein